MITDKKHVQQIAEVLYYGRISDIVISPGSRNSPLIRMFCGDGNFKCYSVVDERSAAYFALGLALYQNRPVAIVCSSGTAALNYAPALAEAYYQRVPLIAITADRPPWLIDNNENQCIRQSRIFQDFTCAEITLPIHETPRELRHAFVKLNELVSCVWAMQQPAHINVPLEEPLNGAIDACLYLRKGSCIPVIPNHSAYDRKYDQTDWNLPEDYRVMFIIGQNNWAYNSSGHITLRRLQKDGAVIVAEHLANMTDKDFITVPDIMMSAIMKAPEDFRPHLLFTTDGQVVSKALKKFLCDYPPRHHIHIGNGRNYYDSFGVLQQVIPTGVWNYLCSGCHISWVGTSGHDAPRFEWQQRWLALQTKAVTHLRKAVKKMSFCDMTVFPELEKVINGDTFIHLGNSMPVRYALMWPRLKHCTYLCNRGVSGIDGSLSTAVGFAANCVSTCIADSYSDFDDSGNNVAVIGDLSFFYDSNALWNSHVNPELCIILINNGGGNIFSIIGAQKPDVGNFMYAGHSLNAEGIAKTFGLEYFSASNKEELTENLDSIFSQFFGRPVLLEVFTDAAINTMNWTVLQRELDTIIP
ncbi:MAG: 2-succinyl-5-enolpyruvyl-6-hydroxy-3-cyclohexene-1-carboxylic-acid synthase [Bacteroidales bacterium]|jgi:2-succinyl-5-enolpyruvyl-6-hydroxy-3-cyclohexene-1-carboxylate synthase|nr:2-succinyl-5-enolpyruvyl-6-hydroxy-3-cyclohexene-1-carboxylic-acid synthase [Bacteroidales bacterium]